MARLFATTAVLSLAGCAHVVSNLPDKMTAQIQRDWRCDEMHGEPVAQAPGWETWDVVACGRPMRVSCPHGAHSRWRRCRYPEPEVEGPVSYTYPEGVMPPRQPPPAPSDPAEATVRAALDVRRAAIVACGGGRVVAIDLTWDTGTLSVRLGGELAGSPAEGCVRAVVEGAALPTPSAGRLRHVVAP